MEGKKGKKRIDHTESPRRLSGPGLSRYPAWYPRAERPGPNTDERSRTRCKSIEFDPIDQAADSLPVITRGRGSIARINHLASIDYRYRYFPEVSAISLLDLFLRQGPALFPLSVLFLTIGQTNPTHATDQIKCLGLAFFFFSSRLTTCLHSAPGVDHVGVCRGNAVKRW